jgi:hypothetical protein
MIGEVNNLKKYPMINANYWIRSSYFWKKKIIEHWKNVPDGWYLPSRSSTEEDADRRNIGKLIKVKLNGKRVRIWRDDISPESQFIGTSHPSFNFCHLYPNISDYILINNSKSFYFFFLGIIIYLGVIIMLVILILISLRVRIILYAPRWSVFKVLLVLIIIFFWVVNNTDATYGVNNNSNNNNNFNDNKRNLRSSVRKNKYSSVSRITSPIIIVDDFLVDNNREPVNNSNILGTNLVCPLLSAVSLLTTNFSMETLLEHFMGGGIQDSNSFVDGNCTVYTFVDTIYKCGEVYSSSDILKVDGSSMPIYIFLLF